MILLGWRCVVLLLAAGIAGIPAERDHEHCDAWARQGECVTNAEWMLPHCWRSCREAHAKDSNAQCAEWAEGGECAANPSFMLLSCPESCGHAHRWDPFSRERLGVRVAVEVDVGVDGAQQGGPGDTSSSPRCDDAAGAGGGCNGFDVFLETLQSRHLDNDHFMAYLGALGTTISRLGRLFDAEDHTERRGAGNNKSSNPYADTIRHWSTREEGALVGLAESFLYAVRNGLVALQLVGPELADEKTHHIHRGLELDRLLDARLRGGGGGASDLDWLRRNFHRMLVPLRDMHALLHSSRRFKRLVRPLIFAGQQQQQQQQQQGEQQQGERRRRRRQRDNGGDGDGDDGDKGDDDDDGDGDGSSTTTAAHHHRITPHRPYALSHWRLPAVFKQSNDTLPVGTPNTPPSTATGHRQRGQRPTMPTVELLNAGGLPIPLLGFGTWTLMGDACEAAVFEALCSGYRHIDTADAYGNEDRVGRAVGRWLSGEACHGSDSEGRDADDGDGTATATATTRPTRKEGGGGGARKRDAVFIATKLSHRRDLGAANTRRLVLQQLERLRVGHIDLYYLHSPFGNDADTVRLRRESWRELEAMVDKGIIRSLGVSNFAAAHLAQLLAFVRRRPACIQNKFDLYHQGGLGGGADDVDGISALSLAHNHSIQAVAYSSLNAWPLMMSAIHEPHVQFIARKHQRSPAQIILRWTLEAGLAVIPRSSDPVRIRENAQLFDFALTEREHQMLSAISWFTAVGPYDPLAPNVYSVPRSRSLGSVGANHAADAPTGGDPSDPLGETAASAVHTAADVHL